MKKKIIFSMSCIALLSILLSMVLSGVVSYYDSLEIVKKATIAESRYIQNGIALGGDDYLSDIRSAGYDTAAAQSVRVTVIDTDGTVRFDSVADAANMENHNNRPEVIAARENGAGESVRESDTLNVQSYNYAVMLSDGRVLRLSVGMKTVFGSIERMVPWMLLCSVIILVLAILLSTYRTKQIVAPVNAIDLDHPMENDVYGELSPLLLRLQRQNETIKEKMEELHRKQTEFTAITENMREGFIVVDAKGDVLSYNTSAVRLLDVHPEDDRPQSVLAFNRSPDFRDAVDSALTGTASERITKLAGRSYSLIANPVTNDNGVQGAVIVLLDVTEKEENERLRREFTANVSHELKTPLTSISGYAEIMKDGLVKSADVPRFANNIYTEAQRLIDVTKQSFFEGIKHATKGSRVQDISHAVQTYVESNGFSVVRSFVGHGVGRQLHEEPEVPNFGAPGRGPRLLPGMVIAVEPMVCQGTYEVNVLKDNWTTVTADGKLAAHYENTVLITDGEPEILTVTEGL